MTGPVGTSERKRRAVRAELPGLRPHVLILRGKSRARWPIAQDEWRSAVLTAGRGPNVVRDYACTAQEDRGHRQLGHDAMSSFRPVPLLYKRSAPENLRWGYMRAEASRWSPVMGSRRLRSGTSCERTGFRHRREDQAWAGASFWELKPPRSWPLTTSGWTPGTMRPNFSYIMLMGHLDNGDV